MDFRPKRMWDGFFLSEKMGGALEGSLKRAIFAVHLFLTFTYSQILQQL
jgi:hypothetical protein